MAYRTTWYYIVLVIVSMVIMSLVIAVGGHTSTVRSGLASYYNAPANTLAAKYLPCGTVLELRRGAGHKWHRMTVKDYGPFVGKRGTGKERIFDLSRGGFRRVFGCTSRGVGRVDYRIIRRGKKCKIHKHNGRL